jgi:RNA polymerase subunit RPABC4/transcription elongation factor Spt4
VNRLPFCSNCGSQFENEAKFCPNCGTAKQGSSLSKTCPACNKTISSENNFCPYCATDLRVQSAPVRITGARESGETAYFKGEGELVVKRTEHRGAGRKVASLAMGPVGYLAFGRDKTRKSSAKGTLVVTNEAIYCAGNDYPFDRIISITKQGTISKSVVLTFEKDVEAGGRAGGGVLGVGGMSIEVELKTSDIDSLFRGLERAKMAGIKGL